MPRPAPAHWLSKALTCLCSTVSAYTGLGSRDSGRGSAPVRTLVPLQLTCCMGTVQVIRAMANDLCRQSAAHAKVVAAEKGLHAATSTKKRKQLSGAEASAAEAPAAEPSRRGGADGHELNDGQRSVLPEFVPVRPHTKLLRVTPLLGLDDRSDGSSSVIPVIDDYQLHAQCSLRASRRVGTFTPRYVRGRSTRLPRCCVTFPSSSRGPPLVPPQPTAPRSAGKI